SVRFRPSKRDVYQHRAAHRTAYRTATDHFTKELGFPHGKRGKKREARHDSSSHRASNCPSWARTRTLLIPYHFGFRRRSSLLSVCGLDCAFTFALTRSGGSRPVSTPSPLGAWLGVASQVFADFESIRARRFRRPVR